MRLREEEALRYLGAKGAPDAQIRALLDAAREALFASAAPKHTQVRLNIKIEGNFIDLGGAFSVESAALAERLSGCREAFLFAATLGAGVDRAMAKYAKTDVALAFALQASAASMIECWCDDACEALASSVQGEGLYLTERFSPGYGDFPVAHQTDMLRALAADKRIGLSETASHMLTPLKSVTAIIGLTPVPQAPCAAHKCAACPNLTCEYRKEANA